MSYNTVDEANTYVETHYIDTDELRVLWNGLSEENKQILLNKGKSIIDHLPLSGRKTCTTQTDAFPRNGQTEVPEDVKAAEVEVALVYSNTDEAEIQNQYRRMVNYGISSYSIGNFSESILSYQKNSMQMLYGLASYEAERLLQPWLSGGFSIE